MMTLSSCNVSQPWFELATFQAFAAQPESAKSQNPAQGALALSTSELQAGATACSMFVAALHPTLLVAAHSVNFHWCRCLRSPDGLD
jgi:hypothetical protein